MTSLPQILRERTGDAHRALDAALAARGLLASLSGYREFLTGWFRLQMSLERLLEASGVATLVPEWPSRRRGALIAADLASLGAPLPAVPVPSAAAPLPAAGVLGTAYVIEGATRGSAVVLRSLLARGIANRDDTAFLSANAATRDALWESFRQTLDRHGAKIPAEPVVAAALATFEWAWTCFRLGERPQRGAPPRSPRRTPHTTTG